MKVTVYFMFWGQKCQTDFLETDELHPLDWIRTLYDKGWMDPVEVIRDDGVVTVTEEEMRKLKEKWL